jgi:hypothetical protein
VESLPASAHSRARYHLAASNPVHKMYSIHKALWINASAHVQVLAAGDAHHAWRPPEPLLPWRRRRLHAPCTRTYIHTRESMCVSARAHVRKSTYARVCALSAHHARTKCTDSGVSARTQHTRRAASSSTRALHGMRRRTHPVHALHQLAEAEEAKVVCRCRRSVGSTAMLNNMVDRRTVDFHSRVVRSCAIRWRRRRSAGR